ncbi:MAG: biotin/lipoyl-containing protein [Clostridia bacterium]
MRKFNITVEGNRYEVEVEEIVGGESASAPVAVVTAPKAAAAVVSAPAVAKPKAVAVGAGTKLTAPMPGMLVTYKVEDGATVKKGDVVLVLEAMKMENDISAPCDGVFKSAVTKGTTVSTGDVLAVIA